MKNNPIMVSAGLEYYPTEIAQDKCNSDQIRLGCDDNLRPTQSRADISPLLKITCEKAV